MVSNDRHDTDVFHLGEVLHRSGPQKPGCPGHQNAPGIHHSLAIFMNVEPTIVILRASLSIKTVVHHIVLGSRTPQMSLITPLPVAWRRVTPARWRKQSENSAKRP